MGKKTKTQKPRPTPEATQEGAWPHRKRNTGQNKKTLDKNLPAGMLANT
jgi:hypothetical protein